MMKSFALHRTLALAMFLVIDLALLRAVPPSPSNLSAFVAGSSVTLTWTAPPGAVTGYRIKAGTAPGLSNAANTVLGPMTSLSVSGVLPGTYYVRVHALAADGEGTASNEVAVIVGGDSAGGGCTAASGPRNLTAHVVGSSVAFSWSPAECGAARYIVYAGSSPGARDLAAIDVGTQSRFAASAPPGVYYVHVVAVSAYGSAMSNVVMAAVSASPSPGAAAPSSTAAGQMRLRVMTWNIHHGKTKAGVYDPTAQARFIAAHSPDVVALQEVQTWDEDQPARYERLLEELTGVDWRRQWAPVVTTARTEGNVILTRLPTLSSSSHQMHATGDWNAMYSNRSAARVEVQAGAVRVQVFSTHLDYYNTTHRTAQVLDLLEWTRQFGGPRIVAGDFNSTPGEYWITAMLGDYADTWRDVTGASSGGATINGVRFDYVFRAKEGGDRLIPVAVRVPETSLSDHAPVVADYSVSH
jgi:endonuclease/exonuclease/phosphatase family metal-dependent hydrolase